MGASASLSEGAITVDPGGEATCEIRVRNSGAVVDQFSLDIVGDAAPWATVQPPMLNLFPGAEGVAQVLFKPPKSAKIAAGEVAFGVRVVSKEDIQGSVVEEGTVTIGGFAETTAELLPRTSRGRRKARHELAVDNRGNHRVNADILFNDPDQLLKFKADPPALVTEPGTATFAKIEVAPKKTFWRGQNKTLPFQVIVAPEQGEPVVTDGTMVQEAVLPKWLLPAILGLIALLIIAFILWNTLFKSAVESAARDVVADDLSAVEDLAADADEKADDALDAAGGGGGGDGGGDGGGGGGGGEETTTTVDPNATNTTVPVPSSVFDTRLSVSAAPNATQDDVFDVEDGKTLAVTDLVFQNPQGDSGRIRIRRGDGGPILFDIGLQNYRDLDYHFVTPLRFAADQDPVLEVECVTPGGGAQTCSAAAYLGGTLEG